MKKIFCISLILFGISNLSYGESLDCYNENQGPGVYSNGSTSIDIVIWADVYNYYGPKAMKRYIHYQYFESTGWTGPKYYTMTERFGSYCDVYEIDEYDICEYIYNNPGQDQNDSILAWGCAAASLAESGAMQDILNGLGTPDDLTDIVSSVIDMESGSINDAPAVPPYENPAGSSEKADPVFMSNGEYGLSATDIIIPGKVLPVIITRTYGSKREYNSHFGYGWDMNYNMKVRRLADTNSVILLDGGGYRREYTRDVSDPNIYERSEDKGTYFDYDSVNETFTLVNKSGMEYAFDPNNGNLSSITDKNGNRINFEYDSSGLMPIYGPSSYFQIEQYNGPENKYGLVAMEYRLSAIVDDLNRRIEFAYDSNGLVSSITDFADRTWIYSYNSNTNDLIQVTDPNNLTIKYSYDFNHNLLTVTDANNQTYLENHYAYNLDENVEWQKYGDANYVFTYDDANNKAVTTDREGYVTNMLYSSSGQILSETVYTADSNDEPNSFTTQHLYDSASLELLRTTLPAGNCIDYTYDGMANVTGVYRKTEPNEPNLADEPNVIGVTYTYDSNHIYDINSVTDPMGNTTKFEYDTNGNVTKITYPQVAVYGQAAQQPVVEYTYNQYGQTETVTAPDGIVTKYQYYTNANDVNNFGHLWKTIADYNETGGMNIATEYQYDRLGRVIEVTDSNGDTTKFEYNKLDLLTKTTTPSPYEYVTNFTYNKNKKLKTTTKVKTGDDQITSCGYDILDNLKTVTDPLGFTTAYGYTKNEDPNLVRDAENNSTKSVYDERGLVKEVIDANGNITQYTYTPNGDINSIEDARGNITNYAYDKFGRLHWVQYPNDTNEVFGYDKNSNIISKKNRGGQIIKFEYDALNRLEVKNRLTDPNIYFSYDIAGRVKEVNDLRSVSNGGGITTYGYDHTGRITQTQDPGLKTIDYEYNSRGLRTKLTYPDDSNVTYKYDSLSRLTEIKYNNSIVASYGYDELSRRKLLTLGNDANAVYTYDLGDRLTKLDNHISGATHIIFDYTHDNVGNRKTLTIDSNLTDKYYYAYDNLYQLKNVNFPTEGTNIESFTYGLLGNRSVSMGYTTNILNQYTVVNSISYTYDSKGNLTYDGTYTYIYDSENRLIDVNDTSSSVAKYKYDYSGRRVSKTVDGTTIKYCYEGDKIIAEYDGSGNLLRNLFMAPALMNQSV